MIFLQPAEPQFGHQMVRPPPKSTQTRTAFPWLDRTTETTRLDVDPMHKSRSPKRKSFRRVAIATTALVTGGAAAALMAGVTPATAAHLATQPDTQVAVFMVPLTILVAAVLYEVARIALRGNLPAEAPARRRASRHWATPGDER
jgi:hypothetical protein